MGTRRRTRRTRAGSSSGSSRGGRRPAPDAPLLAPLPAASARSRLARAVRRGARRVRAPPCRSRASPTSRRWRRFSSTSTASSRTPGTILLDALVNDRPAVCVLYDEGAPAGEIVGGSRASSASTTATSPRRTRSTGPSRSTRSSPESSARLSDPGELADERRRGSSSGSSARSTAVRRAGRRRDSRRARCVTRSAPAIVGIYREANAPAVARLLEPALEAGGRRPGGHSTMSPASLAARTVGEGAGEKLPLLNQAARAARAAGGPRCSPTTTSPSDRGDVVSSLRCATVRGSLSRSPRTRRAPR